MAHQECVDTSVVQDWVHPSSRRLCMPDTAGNLGATDEGIDHSEYLRRQLPQESLSRNKRQQSANMTQGIACVDTLTGSQSCIMEPAGKALTAMAKLRNMAQQLSNVTSCNELESARAYPITLGPQSCHGSHLIHNSDSQRRALAGSWQRVQFKIPEAHVSAPIPPISDTLRPLRSSFVAWYVSESPSQSSWCEQRPRDPYRTPGARKRQLSVFNGTPL